MRRGEGIVSIDLPFEAFASAETRRWLLSGWPSGYLAVARTGRVERRLSLMGFGLELVLRG